MKIKSLIYVIAAMCMALGFQACSDDDDNVSSNLGEAVAGTYSGYTLGSCAYFEGQLSTDQTITVLAASETTVNISYVSDTWGTFTIESATVTASGNTYVIEGDGATEMGMGTTTSSYSASVEVVINSDKSVASCKFTVPSVMGGLTIEFIEGDVPASSVIEGSYSGYALASCAYFEGMLSTDQTIMISAVSGTTVNISYVSDTWGAFTIESATVTASGNTYVIEGEGTTEMGMGATTSSYSASVEAVINSDKSVASCKFTVPSVMGGLTIEFIEGNAPAAYEVAGDYSGSLDISLGGVSLGTVDGTVTIAASSDDVATLTLSSFDISTVSIAIPEIAIENVSVTENEDGSYGLSGSFENLAVSIDDNSSFTVSGTVEGTVTDGVAELTFDLATDMLANTSITVKFTSTVEE